MKKTSKQIRFKKIGCIFGIAILLISSGLSVIAIDITDQKEINTFPSNEKGSSRNGDEYFYSVEYSAYDSDSDGYNDAIEVIMDIDTTTQDWVLVTVCGYLISSSGLDVDNSDSDYWIYSNVYSTNSMSLIVPEDSESGWFNVELFLYDDEWNEEDYIYEENVAQLYPLGYSIDSDEYFYNVIYTEIDSDSDGYNDGLQVQIDVDTTDGSVTVNVCGNLIDPSLTDVDEDSVTWEITGTNIEYEYLYLYVPNNGMTGYYDVELYLYDDQLNEEDYRYDSFVAELYPSDYNPIGYINVNGHNWDALDQTIAVYIDGLDVQTINVPHDTDYSYIHEVTEGWHDVQITWEPITDHWEVVSEYNIWVDQGLIEPVNLAIHGYADWTIMVYMAADYSNPLNPLPDIESMQQIGSTNSKLNIVVLCDYYDWDEPMLWRIDHYTSPNNGGAILDDNEFIIPSSNEINMGDPETLANFVTWTTDRYHSKQGNCLVLWDHGHGWQGVCDDLGDTLELDELKWAFDNINNHLMGEKIEILMFDACLMGMVEIVYELRNNVDYITASENIMLNPDMPYEQILLEIYQTIDMDAEYLATTIVDKYITYTNFLGATYSAIKTNGLNTVLSDINSFSQSLINGITSYKSLIESARSNTEQFAGYPIYDLFHFTELIHNSISDTTIKNAAQILMNSLDSAIIAEGHGPNHPNAHGLSIYYPETISEYDNRYNSISFSSNSLWDEFLQSYYQAQNSRKCGDVNDDDEVNVSDAVWLINYVFTGGPPPDPLCIGDANSDGSVNVSDAVCIINYVFVGGFPPHDRNEDGMVDPGSNCDCVLV